MSYIICIFNICFYSSDSHWTIQRDNRDSGCWMVQRNHRPWSHPNCTKQQVSQILRVDEMWSGKVHLHELVPPSEHMWEWVFICVCVRERNRKIYLCFSIQTDMVFTTVLLFQCTAFTHLAKKVSRELARALYIFADMYFQIHLQAIPTAWDAHKSFMWNLPSEGFEYFWLKLFCMSCVTSVLLSVSLFLLIYSGFENTRARIWIKS